MKRISMFIMILICMVSFTSTATTAKMEQKQKSEFVKTFNVESNAVSVVNEINVVSVLTDAAIKNEIKVRSFEAKEPFKLIFVNADVGWFGVKADNSIKFNKESQNQEIVFIDPLTRYCRSNC